MTTTQADASIRVQQVARTPRPAAAVARLSSRLIRRGTLAISVGVALLVVVEAIAFRSGYPDEASRAALTVWAEDPGIRIIAGPGSGVETLGGFVVWDAGLYLTLILGAWSMTTASRVLRGDEGAGRTDNLLAGPIRPAHALLIQLLVLLGACGVVGASVGIALALSGADPAGSALYGAATVGYCAALVGLVAVASQVFSSRITTLGVSAIAFAVLVLVRTAGNSHESRTWLTWLAPSGWIDQARAFSENRWPTLLVPVAVTAVLLGMAVAVRGHRDTGAGLMPARTAHRSHRWGLGSPMAFAWRSNQGVLLAWAGGIAAAGMTVGALLPTFEENLADDVGFQQILTAMGMDVANMARSFVGMWATVLGLVMAVYVAFRMGSVRAEESSTRLDTLLARPVPRWRWLGGHVACLVASVVVLCTAGATAMWLSGLAADASLTATDAFTSMLNTMPAVVLFAGLGVLAFGLVPRMTVVVTAAVAVAAYVLEMVGPILEWPAWVLGLSPFHHLASVPVDPIDGRSAVVMIVIGVVLAALGMAAFERRDLVGS